MFYRFLSKLATQDRLEAFPVPIPESNKVHYIPWFDDYETKFRLLPQKIPIVGVNVFEAPFAKKCDGRDRGLFMRFHPNKETDLLPDIWGVNGKLIVSEKVKKVLGQVDVLEHEFTPIDWTTDQEKIVKTKQQYYWMFQRRYLHIVPNARIATSVELGFCPHDDEENFIARVIDTPFIRDYVEQFPVWQHLGSITSKRRMLPVNITLYMNEMLVEAMKNEGITGMDLYSVRYGQAEESLSAL